MAQSSVLILAIIAIPLIFGLAIIAGDIVQSIRGYISHKRYMRARLEYRLMRIRDGIY